MDRVKQFGQSLQLDNGATNIKVQFGRSFIVAYPFFSTVHWNAISVKNVLQNTNRKIPNADKYTLKQKAILLLIIDFF